MKKYELVKTVKDYYELYFYNEEFNCWEFIKNYKNNTTIKEIKEFIESNNKNENNIKLTYIF